MFRNNDAIGMKSAINEYLERNYIPAIHYGGPSDATFVEIIKEGKYWKAKFEMQNEIKSVLRESSATTGFISEATVKMLYSLAIQPQLDDKGYFNDRSINFKIKQS